MGEKKTKRKGERKMLETKVCKKVKVTKKDVGRYVHVRWGDTGITEGILVEAEKDYEGLL